VGTLLLYLSFHNNRLVNLRTQSFVMPFFLLLAAGSVTLVEDLLPRRRRLVRALTAALVVLPVIGLAGRVGFVTARYDQQQEYDFLRASVLALPVTDGTILTVSNTGGANNLDAFPLFLLQVHGLGAWRLADLDAAAQRGAWPAARPGLLFYQGMYCYFSPPLRDAPASMHSRCLAARQHYTLRPLRVASLPGPGYSGLNYVGGGRGPFEVGFFEVTGER
jgi:hypothetical protein